MVKSVGDTIYFKLTVSNIRRNPKVANNASIETKFEYYDKIRVLCKELCEVGEYSNAETLYARSLQTFASVSKKIRSELSPEQIERIDSCQTILHTNLATCFLQRKMFDECLKHANKALEITPDCAKA